MVGRKGRRVIAAYWITVAYIGLAFGFAAYLGGTIQFVGLQQGDIALIMAAIGSSLFLAFAFARENLSGRD